jgi:PAS domain S-box-containing protein
MVVGIYYAISSSMSHILIQKNSDLLETLKREIVIFLEDIESDLVEVEKIIDDKIVSEDQFPDYLDLKILSNRQIHMIQILDANHIVQDVAPYNESLLGIDLSGHPFVQKAKNLERDSWSPVFISPLNRKPTITYTSLNENYGIVFYINLDFLGKSILHETNDELGFPFVLDSNGTFLAHPDPSVVIRRENMRNIPEVMEVITQKEILQKRFLSGDNIISLMQLSATQWILGFSQPKEEAFSIVRTFRSTGFLVGFITLVIAFIMALFTLKDTVTPITKLIYASKLVSSGDYSTRLEESPIREVDELSQQFKLMISSVEEREGELEYLRNYLSNIVDSMPSLLISFDQEGRILLWNSKAEETTGITSETAVGKSLKEVYPQIAINPHKILDSIKYQKTISWEKRKRRTKEGIVHENIIIYPVTANGIEGAVLRVDDVSAMVHMEEMMIQSEKILSVGGLAAGMAHEINNPLAGIIQTCGVMANRLGKRIDLPVNRAVALEAGTNIEAIKKFMELRGISRMLESIMEAGQRASTIINNILSFARKSDGKVSSHSINDIINKTLDLVATDYDLKKNYDFKSITIKKDFNPDLPPVPCEEPKIQQVLLNIFRNGAQAMQGADTENPVFLIRTYLDQSGKMVSIEIEDNGPGMDEHVKKRVFEPFYSTKPVGLGTGLGLSVSYFIISENHHGELSVESEPNNGTTFIIRLPVQR